MADKKDDPREVLTLLNSLGFVGITAQQLKAFMKDLKMHRKIKERERQQWKDETKKKILSRQQELYREVLQEHKMETMSFNNATESTISSESSTFQDDSSYKVVTVKIRCIPKDKENEPEENGNNQVKKTSFGKTQTTSWAEQFRQNSSGYEDNGYNTSSSSSIHESHRRFNSFNNQSQNHSAGASTDSTKYISLEKPGKRASRSEKHLKQSNLAPSKSPLRTKSSNSRNTDDKSESFKHSQSTADVPTNPPPSRSSVHSKPKSFIRPWRLQPESHRSSTNTKSDPVALYQKYREEWKQLALPGEENHAGIRWAVREKMLGIDPNPRWDVEMIEEINRDFTSNSSGSRNILDHKEYKVYRRTSRKTRKQFSNSNPVQSISKPVFIARRKQYSTSSKSVSESFLVQSTSFELRNTGKSRSPRLPNGIIIEHNFKTESVSYLKDNSLSREIRSGVTSAKQTLGRLINKLLNTDINSYAETYKYMDKCCCVLRTRL